MVIFDASGERLLRRPWRSRGARSGAWPSARRGRIAAGYFVDGDGGGANPPVPSAAWWSSTHHETYPHHAELPAECEPLNNGQHRALVFVRLISLPHDWAWRRVSVTAPSSWTWNEVTSSTSSPTATRRPWRRG